MSLRRGLSNAKLITQMATHIFWNFPLFLPSSLPALQHHLLTDPALQLPVPSLLSLLSLQPSHQDIPLAILSSLLCSASDFTLFFSLLPSPSFPPELQIRLINLAKGILTASLVQQLEPA